MFDGVALSDPVGKTKYLVARDSDGRCVCSNSLSSPFVKAGAAHSGIAAQWRLRPQRISSA